MASVSSRLIGKGEIVPRRYELEAARREFFAVLWELVPEALDAIFEMSRRRMEGPERTWAARQWQATYRLPDEWAYRATRMPPGVEEDFVLLNPVSIYEGRERECDPRDGTTVIFPGGSRYVLRSGMIRDRDSYAILIAHLLYEDPDGGTEWPGDADIGDFDPRAETVDQATERLLPMLEHRLRCGLQSIVEDDKAVGDGVPTRALPPRHHFEWTVRYQVLGETYAQIAEADGVSKESNWVSISVRAVADLIGLTLRAPDKGGRPRKRLPTRKARTIVIPHNRKNTGTHE